MKLTVSLAGATLAIALAGCATTPSGRSQVMLVDDQQMNAMGIAAFTQMRSEGKVSTNAAQQRYVRCVSDALIAQLPSQWQGLPWEVEVFVDDAANAFALPGGKVGVNTGMFKVAQNQDQLAAVVGHELAHVMYRHGAERVSQQLLAQAGMTAATLAANASSPENSQLIVGALGAGAQIGVLLPFSRHHESEADLEGQRLMARAGFRPAESVTLWQRMREQSGGNNTPTWLSTHPNPGGRINALGNGLAASEPLFEQAAAAGRRPQCRL